MRRVVVTGLGIVSSIGNNRHEVVESLRAGKSGIVFAEDQAEHGFRSHAQGSIDINVEEHIDRRLLRFMGAGAAYNHIAMQQAIADLEQIGRLLDGVVSAFRADRLGTNPPRDALQNVHTAGRLARGETTGADVHAEWNAQLPARRIQGALIDWLLWWDNAYLDITRAHLPHAELLMVVRDPRDMLLNWLAFGSPVPFRMGTPEEGAAWLAQGLEHIVVLAEQELQPLLLLRTDEAGNDPRALSATLAQLLGVELPVPPPQLFSDQYRFPAGNWRRYNGVLGAAFAALTPVAVRLGYSET